MEKLRNLETSLLFYNLRNKTQFWSVLRRNNCFIKEVVRFQNFKNGFEFDCKQRISTTTNRVIGELEIIEPGNDYFFWRVSRSQEKKENFINKSLPHCVSNIRTFADGDKEEEEGEKMIIFANGFLKINYCFFSLNHKNVLSSYISNPDSMDELL